MKQRPPSKVVTTADREAAARLKAIWEGMKPNRPTQQALADAWPYQDREANQSLISQYMNAKIALNHRAVLFFAQQFGVPPTAIRSDLPEQLAHVTDDATAGLWTDVTAFRQQAAAGHGIAVDEYSTTGSLKFKRSSLQRKGLYGRKLNVFYASGDSMEPRIHDGDALLFNTEETSAVDGEIFIVKHDGSYLVKRMHKYGNQWFLVSDNGVDSKWKKPVPVDFDDGFEIIGRVRWIGSWVD